MIAFNITTKIRKFRGNTASLSKSMHFSPDCFVPTYGYTVTEMCPAAQRLYVLKTCTDMKKKKKNNKTLVRASVSKTLRFNRGDLHFS